MDPVDATMFTRDGRDWRGKRDTKSLVRSSENLKLRISNRRPSHPSRSSRLSRMSRLNAVSAAERVERFLEALADAGENRRIAQRVAGAFGFAERHHEIQEVFRLIAFKRHHPFLV